MNIPEDKLLLGFYMNRVKDPNGQYMAGVGLGVDITMETFNKACDVMYTHMYEHVGKEGREPWTFFFSVMVSVVNSIKEKRPDIMEKMVEITR